MMGEATAQSSVASGTRPAGLRLLCPGCRKEIFPLSDAEQACPGCGFCLTTKDGAIEALGPGREEYFRDFFREYLAVRKAEGRGSDSAPYYLALPYEDTTGNLSWQWEMRGKTYGYLERRVLPELERQTGRPLDVLDLGAGVGWLSYRLAMRGHRPAAVDLLTDPLDGLGAARHYQGAIPTPFPAFQAEFDRLPFADEQFDLAIFNSSFHYATDYWATLQEVRRCLRWGGQVVIMDTPVYRRYEDGEQMREERHRQFEEQYGFRSDSVPSMEYVDEAMLKRLGKDLNVHWKIHRPWYGWQWHARPLKAWWMRRRAPSRFWILVGSWGTP